MIFEEQKARKAVMGPEDVFSNEGHVRAALISAIRAYAMERELPHTYEPIENRLNLGTFDFFIAAGGHAAWVETKFELTARRKPRLRRGQPAFGARMAYAGMPAVVLVGHADGSWRLLSGATTADTWRSNVLSTGTEWGSTLIDRIFAVEAGPW